MAKKSNLYCGDCVVKMIFEENGDMICPNCGSKWERGRQIAHYGRCWRFAGVFGGRISDRFLRAIEGRSVEYVKEEDGEMEYRIREERDAEGRKCYSIQREGYDMPAMQLYYSKKAAREGIEYLKAAAKDIEAEN